MSLIWHGAFVAFGIYRYCFVLVSFIQRKVIEKMGNYASDEPPIRQ